MKTLVFLVEEPSAEEMLSRLVPKILKTMPGKAETDHNILVFQGKSDLEDKLVRRLRRWRKPDSFFMIIRDQDSGDCHMIKKNLMNLCRKAGKSDCLVRIACHELESFYLGDLAAVEAGLSIQGLKEKQMQKKYRSPDSIARPSDELVRITGRKYQKMAGSRAITPHMDLSGNRSQSFNTLVQGIKHLIEQ